MRCQTVKTLHHIYQRQTDICSAERAFQPPDTQPAWLTNVYSSSRDVPVRGSWTLYWEVTQLRQPCAKFAISIEWIYSASTLLFPPKSPTWTFPPFIRLTRLVYCLLFNKILTKSSCYAVTAIWTKTKARSKCLRLLPLPAYFCHQGTIAWSLQCYIH